MSSAAVILRRPAHRLSVVFALLFFATAIGSGMAGMVEARNHPRMGHPEPYYTAAGAAPPRRRLAGPGSSPPTCRARCGRCYPCRPVHVAIQPGRSIPLEYYPEAWRCKCGKKLFMP